MPKFKVMFVVHSLGIGGTERLVYDMTIELKNRGIEVCVCCLDSLGMLGEKLRKDSFKVFVLERKEGIDFEIIGKIKSILKIEKPNIVNPHQYTPYFYTMLSTFSFNRPKIVFTEHGRFFPDRTKFRRIVFNQIAQFFTDAITGVCNYTKEVLVKYEKFNRKNIKVIHNGVRPESFLIDVDINQKKKSLGLDQNDRIIGSIGRLCPEKNYRMLIAAFSEVRKQLSDVKLLIIGEGDLRNELERFSKELNLEKSIYFLGERQDVSEALKIFDVFALSSDSEAASLVLLEAMASGLAVVATRVGGNPELILEGKTGFLVPRGDHEQFAKAIITLLQNPSLAGEMGAFGRKRVIENFAFHKMIDGYLELYRSLLNCKI